MRKTWVETNHLFEGNMEHCWIIWSVRDDGLWVIGWVEIYAKSSCMHQRWSNRNSKKLQHLAWSNMAWGYWEIILENINLEQFATRSFDIHLDFVVESFCLLLLLTWFAWLDVAWWENLKTFTIIFQFHHLQNKVHDPCTTKKQVDDEISIHVVDHILAYSSPTSIYNNKSCCYKLRWNCRKESWWSWYHRFPNLGRVVLCRRRDKRKWRWHRCHFLHIKKMQKIRKEEEKKTYFQAPTFATTMKLLLFSHFYCHHVEDLFVRALLKLLALETLVDFALLKF